MPQDGVVAPNMLRDTKGIKLREVEVCHFLTTNTDNVMVWLNDGVEAHRLMQRRQAGDDAVSLE